MAAFHKQPLSPGEEVMILALLRLWQRGEMKLNAITERTGRSYYMLEKVASKHGIALKQKKVAS